MREEGHFNGWFGTVERLAKISPDANGYYLMHPDVKQFPKSKPAAGAFLKTVMGDLSHLCGRSP